MPARARAGIVCFILATIVFLFAAGLASVQLASDAIFSSAGSRTSFPAHLPLSVGVRIYGAVAAVAPAAYAEAMLARAALDRGRLADAERAARLLPDSPTRADLLGTIAQRRGDERAAQEYYLEAPDFFAIQRDVNRLAVLHPAMAYALEMKLHNRLAALTTHPDLVAETNWRLGQLATARSYADPKGRRVWLTIGMRDYRRAIAVSPLSVKYLLAAGVQDLALGDPVVAGAYFRRALDVDPANADAYAGLGLAAIRRQDRAGAQRYAEKSRSIDPKSHMLRTLDVSLR